ncbi:TlpA family protein disulfide reductase [Pedobacter ureilyticus]|uniref:TlpA family protein disulfide reductase n=1 Tax=Pedobacter ureilyticus TaxID=1393051 RepID=A0ABW9JAR5_9SPHI|nr:TlpA disulfide reductase family protein [Pedobacter helvus]
MKTHFFTKCVLLLCPFFGQQVVAQTVSWSPNPPLQQKKISFTYEPKGGDLEFSDEPKASLALYTGNRWRKADIELKSNGKVWTGEYQLPENTAFVALKFYQGDPEKPEAVDNNNGKGYFSRVLGTNKKDVSGSFIAETALRSGLTGNWMFNSYVNTEKNTKVIDSLLLKEEKLSRKSMRPFLFTYLDLKRLIMPATEFSAFADQMLQKELKKGRADEELLAGIQRYYIRMKDTAAAQGVEDMIYKSYPKSSTARFLAYKRATDGKSGNDFQVGAESFLSKFPYLEWKKQPDNGEYIYYTIFRGLGAHYFETGQIEKFTALFKDIDFKTANEIYRWNLTRAQIMGKGDFNLFYSLSKMIIPYLLERKSDLSYMIDFGNNKEKALANAEKQLDERLFTHIFLANALADYTGAEQSFQYLSDKGKYSTADLNDLHFRILEKLGRETEIKTVLEKSVSANAVTPAMFIKLKEIYKKAHGDKDMGYEQYVASMIPNDKKAEMRAHVMAGMVNHPLPPFVLEDADGNFVDSQQFGDKVVVIDFWATWCRPCIMAFPGMQLLVDQYAKDPQVAIYMIGTMQSGDYKTKSVNYVRGEGYRFNLLHDAVGPKGEQDQVFKSLVPLFKSSGIPRKIIVKNGMVRYSSEGYSGSPSQLRDELSMAVEILRAEK